MAPRLGETLGGHYLTWLEPGAGSHRLRVSRLDGGAWSEPVTIASGDDFFANWADLPAVAQSASGEIVAHWLGALGESTYAYGVQTARSVDDGKSWSPSGLLHDDNSPQEHGFVSYTPRPDSGIQAFWLDGRGMGNEGLMQLRTAVTGLDDQTPTSTVLDEKVCECCSTDTTWTAQGALVVYRDRSDDEIRDISIVRETTEGWSAPSSVHEDGWQINGCPVNGPAVDATNDRVVVAWFTAAGDAPRVLASFSEDAGVTFATPLEVDVERPKGRVDVAWDARGEAWVVWMARDGRVQLRNLSRPSQAPITVASTSGERKAGFPKIRPLGSGLLLAWKSEEGIASARISPAPMPSSS